MVRKQSDANTPRSGAAWRRYQNNIIYRQFLLAALSGRFEWKGLPDTVDEDYLERTLVFESNAVFFEDVAGDLRATQVILDTTPDINNNYNQYRAMGANGVTYDIPDGEGVVMWDNRNRNPSMIFVEKFAEELANVDERQRVNRDNQVNTVAFSGPPEMAADLQKMVRNMQMSDQQVVVTPKFQQQIQIQALETGIKYLQKEYHEDFTALLNRAYLFFGIDHLQFEKQAHMLESEAEKGADAVLRMRDYYLGERQKAVRQINKKFGTSISVEWRDSGREVEKTVMAEEEADE